jgi:uncharacterized protein YndB with AHSA1/START domain
MRNCTVARHDSQERSMTDLIQREVTLPAPPDAVWQALTDPEWLREWLADEAALELRPGGDARFRIGDATRSGWVEEATPPTDGATGRLAFWWELPGEPASRVTLELTSIDEGTRLRVVETRPLDVIELIGVPLEGPGGLGTPDANRYGPALVAA